MRPVDHSTVARVATWLTDPDNARPAVSFPRDLGDVDRAGLYSWWADAGARATIGEVLGEELAALIYAGQAGATRWPSGKRSTATLASRINGNHLNGNASSSTFRLTISAILLDPLGLSVARPGRLVPSDRERVSAWMRAHLSLATASFDDRDALEDLEVRVLKVLDPPLNLKGMPPSAVRDRVAALRRSLTHPREGDGFED